jgi:hypothetical protein
MAATPGETSNAYSSIHIQMNRTDTMTTDTRVRRAEHMDGVARSRSRGRQAFVIADPE